MMEASQNSASVSYPGGSASTVPLANAGQLQQRLAGLVAQLAGLQQQQGYHLVSSGSAMQPSLQAALPAAAINTVHDHTAPLAPPLARTTTNAGALLRTLSTRNPRVLALAAAAAKAAAGTPEHAAVLSALKDEILQATGQPEPAAAAAQDTAARPAAVDAAAAAAATAGGHAPAMQAAPVFPGGTAPAAAAQETGSMPAQQHLTQDALWAALMAKATARSGSATNPSSPQAQQQQQQQQQPPKQHSSPKPLPGHGSSDSAMEVEGTSCALPWALLQAAQQAQQEEEEKEAAAAAAAAAAAGEAAAGADTAAAADPFSGPTAMDVDMPDGASGSPSRAKSSSSGLARGGSTVVFKRRNMSNSNALQKHFNKPAAQQQPTPALLARSQSEVALGVPKPQHTFKKQLRKRPLVLRGNSSGNLALLQQLAKPQEGSQAFAAAAAEAAGGEQECSADTGPAHTTPAAAAGGGWAGGGASSLLALQADRAPAQPSLSGLSLRAPAATAPAVIGSSAGVGDVLNFLATREKQLQALQEQLQLHRRRMAPAAGDGCQPALAGLAGRLAALPGTPTGTAYTANTAAAIQELKQLLSGMAATAAAPTSPGAFTAGAAAPTLLQAAAEGGGGSGGVAAGGLDDFDTTAAATAVMLAQAKYRLAQQQQQQQQQYQWQEQEPMGPASVGGSVQVMSTLKALAAALVAGQQQQQLAPAAAQPSAASAGAGMPSINADLIRSWLLRCSLPGEEAVRWSSGQQQ